MRKDIIAQFYKVLSKKKKGEEEEEEKRRTSAVYMTSYSNIYHIQFCEETDEDLYKKNKKMKNRLWQ